MMLLSRLKRSSHKHQMTQRTEVEKSNKQMRFDEHEQ